jgi:Response regulator containing CheY-like receiver, AAA-type ATPase, and DNA-binding domains
MEELIIIIHQNDKVCRRFQKHLKAILVDVKVKIRLFNKLEDAKDVIKKQEPNILFLGIWFNEKKDGIEYCKDMKKWHPKTRVVIIASYEDSVDFDVFINTNGNTNGFITENANNQIIKRAIEKLKGPAGSFFQYDEYTPKGGALDPLTVDPQWYSMVAQIIKNQDDNKKKIEDSLKLIHTLENNIIYAAKNPAIYKAYNKELQNIIFRRSYNDWKIARTFGVNKNDVTQARSIFANRVQRNQSVIALVNTRQDKDLKDLTETNKQWIIQMAAEIPSKKIAKMTPKNSNEKTTPTESMKIETFNKKRNELLNDFHTNDVGLVFKALENKIISWDDIKTTRKNYLVTTLNEFIDKFGIYKVENVFKALSNNTFTMEDVKKFRLVSKEENTNDVGLIFKALEKKYITWDEVKTARINNLVTTLNEIIEQFGIYEVENVFKALRNNTITM